MKFSDVTFPHPVLGVGDTIHGEIGLTPEPEINQDNDNYKITIHCSHNNEDLKKLINSHQAEYFCDTTCTNTLYRKNIVSDNCKIEFDIPRKQVKGRVEFSIVLVAKQNIPRYTNANAHPDYSGFEFEIDKGDVLGYFGSFHFDADIKYEKLKAVSSFMEVLPNEDPKELFTNIDLEKNKIEVQLPHSDFEMYSAQDISKEVKFSSIIQSSIVLNALLVALYNFNQYPDKLWARTLKARFDSEKEFENLSIEDPQNIPEIAQRLLGNPFNRLLAGLKVIIESTNKAED